jgi:hypothetical protein
MYLIVILNPKKTKASAEERGVLSYKLAYLTHKPTISESWSKICKYKLQLQFNIA